MECNIAIAGRQHTLKPKKSELSFEGRVRIVVIKSRGYGSKKSSKWLLFGNGRGGSFQSLEDRNRSKAFTTSRALPLS
jgi:hypothetical protein